MQPGISHACNLEVAVSINDHSTIKRVSSFLMAHQHILDYLVPYDECDKNVKI